MNSRAKTTGLVILILIAVLKIGWDTRTVNPYPKNYLTRLQFLKYTTKENCFGYIANAHGDREGQFDFWTGDQGRRLTVIAELSDRREIRESDLKPGDVANFHADHVAAYLGNGMWVDMDCRRGFAASWKLNDKPASDPWFAYNKPVRILRWN